MDPREETQPASQPPAWSADASLCDTATGPTRVTEDKAYQNPE